MAIVKFSKFENYSTVQYFPNSYYGMCMSLRIYQSLSPPSEIRCFLIHHLGNKTIRKNGYYLKTLPFGTPCSQWSCTWIMHHLDNLVTPIANIPRRASLRSAGRQDLVVPRSRLVSSERAFSVAAPRAWNDLLIHIRLITDTKLFKTKLQTFLFNSAYHIVFDNEFFFIEQLRTILSWPLVIV